MNASPSSNIEWPEFAPPKVEIPEDILRQLAARLEERTNGLVVAEVSSNYDPDGGTITHKFLLKAPYMGKSGYSYVLFRVRGEGAKLYPVTIYDYIDLPADFDESDVYEYSVETKREYNEIVNNANHFKNKISKIINSHRTKEIIETLMLRSKRPAISEKQMIE